MGCRHGRARVGCVPGLGVLGAALAWSLTAGVALGQDTGGRGPSAPPAMLSPATTASGSSWTAVTANDKLGRVTKLGSGARVMVLIPGSAQSGAIFEKSFERYADDTTMYAVTMRGNGGTDPLPGAPNEWANREWTNTSALGVAEFIAANDLKDVVIVGHGNGAQVAWLAAMQQPSRVAGLISLDGYAFHPLDPGSTQTRGEMVQALEDRMSRTNDDNHASLRMTVAGASVQSPEHARFIIDDHMLTPRVVHRRYMLEAQAVDIKEQMIALAKPALVIAALPENTRGARHDVMRTRFESVYGQVPGAFVEYFEDARHFVMFDSPDLVETAVMEFLGSLPAVGGAGEGSGGGTGSTKPDREEGADKKAP